MQRFFGFLAVLGLIASSAPASARHAALNTLPEWRETTRSAKKPASVPARERAPGVKAFRERSIAALAAAPQDHSNDELSKWQTFNFASIAPRTCLMLEAKEKNPAVTSLAREGEPMPIAFSNQGGIQTFSQPGIYAVRAETLRRTGAHRAELEIARFWFDTRTLGTRLYARESEPLVELARGPDELRVFAGRSGDLAHFVVVGSDIPKQLREQPNGESMLSQIGFQLIAQVRSSDGQVFNSLCRHVLLDSDPNQESSMSVSIGILTGPRSGKAGSAGDLLFRRVNIELSSSRISTEKVPLVAASMGFQGQPARLAEIVNPDLPIQAATFGSVDEL